MRARIRLPPPRRALLALAASGPRSGPSPPLWLPIARRTLSTPAEPAEKNRDKKPTTPTTRRKDLDPLSNPILDEYLAKKDREEANVAGHDSPKRPPIREGRLSSHESSLFLPEREFFSGKEGTAPEGRAAILQRAKLQLAKTKAMHDKELSDMTTDPAPLARRKLQRKLVIAGLRNRGRLTKVQNIMRTERQTQYTSHFLPTSVKKLQKVVNQVAGKTVSEALVQLRFSPKKVARDVIKGLDLARNEAILQRGMGLGSGTKAASRWLEQRTDAGEEKAAAQDLWSYKTFEEERKARAGGKRASRPTMIELKNGDRKLVRDPTEIYIDQAWVGRGTPNRTLEFRARGRVNRLTHRTTSFSFLLKEEKTRMRISDEIKKKRENRKLWTALPDRPVTAQRQYCLW